MTDHNIIGQDFNISTARGFLAALDPDLLRSVNAAFVAAGRDPLAGLLTMARLTRHDLRVGYIVLTLVRDMLPRPADRAAVAAVVGQFLPATATAGAGPESVRSCLAPRLDRPADSSARYSPACYESSSDGLRTGAGVPESTRANIPSRTVVDGQAPGRVDPELGRLAVLAGVDKYLRFWMAARLADPGGRGWSSRDDLRAVLSSAGVAFTRRHTNAILRSGSGFWWDHDDQRGRVYYVGSERLTARLMASAAAVDSWAALATNLAGVSEVYIPLAGDIQDFRRALYAGWLASRENPTIARATLCRLWGVSVDTLIAWESSGSDIRVRANFGQVRLPGKHDLESGRDVWRLMAFVPPLQGSDDPGSKRATVGYTWDGGRLAWWQIPNTYNSTARAHHARGRAYKRRRVALAVASSAAADSLPGVSWPAAESSDSAVVHGAGSSDLALAGSPASRTFFASEKHLRGYASARGAGAVGYVWLGENWRALRVWELTTSADRLTTHVNALARGLQARRMASDARARVRSLFCA